MARDGTGNYSLPNAPFAYDTVIDEAAVNGNFSDIATALTQSLSSDGQTEPTANLPMSGFRHTGVANASARNQYAAVGQIQDNDFIECGDAGGTADALTLAPSPAITGYDRGQVFIAKATATNTGAATVAISGLAAKTIQRDGVALAAGDLTSGKFYRFYYDGTNFQLEQISAPAPVPTSFTDIDQDVTPDTDSSRDIGSSSKAWAEGHFDKTLTDTLEDRSTGDSLGTEYLVNGTPTTWGALNGTGTIALRSDMNVASVTDGGAGVYTFNFTSAYAAADYAPTTGCRFSGTDAPAHAVRGISSAIPNTGSLLVVAQIGGGGTAFDFDWVSISINGALA